MASPLGSKAWQQLENAVTDDDNRMNVEKLSNEYTWFSSPFTRNHKREEEELILDDGGLKDVALTVSLTDPWTTKSDGITNEKEKNLSLMMPD